MLKGNNVEFEVPFGFTDNGGVIHTHIVMRRVLNKDLIAVANDNKVKELKRAGHKISVAAMRYAASQKELVPGVIVGDHEGGGEIDPIALTTTEAAMIELNAVLFTQVVVSVGDLTQEGGDLNRNTFREMSPADMEVIQAWYAWINTPPKNRRNDPDGNKPPDPTSSSTN